MSASVVIQGRWEHGASPMEIVIAAGRVETIRPATTRTGPVVGGPECLVTEGFLDMQVNGFAGVDFKR